MRSEFFCRAILFASGHIFLGFYFPMSSKKIAIVHDDFIQHGGAEKLVECLLDIFPNADLFTSIISNDWREKLLSKNPHLNIQTSFLDKNPLKKELYKISAPFYPVAFWSFNFANYDLVISSSARFAHGVKTPKETLHVAYINSPARMIWMPESYFNKSLMPIAFPLIQILKYWDKNFASRQPDILIANSKTIKDRIKKYWNRESEVIYPFHELVQNTPLNKKQKGEHFIIVSRLEKWKRIDLAIKACENLKQKLIIVGNGKYKSQLKSMANPEYIKFAGRLSDEELIDHYQKSKALIMTQHEDFGITSVEAQSLGVPVIAYKSGGALETVLENQTGIFFNNQEIESLKAAIQRFNKVELNSDLCIIQANKFTKDKFVRRILDITNDRKQTTE